MRWRISTNGPRPKGDTTPNPQFNLTAGVKLTATVTISSLGMDDLLWVADGDTIQVRAKDNLALIQSFGSTGAGDSNFSVPTGLCVDKACVYVNDSGNARIKKHLGTTLAYHAQETLAGMTASPVGPLAVDRRRFLMGRAAVTATAYNRHKNTFAAEAIPSFACGAGGIVGLAAIKDYFFVATSAQVEKRLLSDGSLVATWNSLPATFAVAGLATDGTWVYALCTKAATDAKIVRLYADDLFENTLGDLTGKQSVYAICCDDTYVYFTDTGDTTINRIDSDIDGTSIVSVAAVTSPRGICCLYSGFDDLPVESVGDVAAAVVATPVLVGGPSSRTSIAAAVTATPVMAATITMPTVSMGAAAATATPALAATVRNGANFSAAVVASPTLAAAVALGEATFGAIPAVTATLGTVTTVTATAEW